MNWALSKTPFLVVLVALILGIIVGVNLSLVIPLLISFLIALLAVTIVCWYYEAKLTKYLLVVLIFILGIILIQSAEYKYQASESIVNYTAQEVELEAVVIDSSRDWSGEYQYTLQPLQVVDAAQEVNYGQVLMQLSSAAEVYDYGERLKVKGSLEKPPTNRNPGAFSYRDYLQREGVYALLREPQQITRQGQQGNPLMRRALLLKEHSQEIIRQTMEVPYSSLLKGLLLGERDLVPPEINEDFNELGFSYLLVVSGFHIGLLVLILNSICRGFKLPQLGIDLASVLLIIVYIVITGGHPSVLRAGLVIILYILGRVWNRSVNIYNILSLVAVVILVYNPYLIFQVGFQLSFTIVLVIIYLTPTLSRYLSFLPKFIAYSISASLAAQLGALPILAYHFNQISLVPILGNLLLMPVVSLIIFFGFLSLLLGSIHLVFAQLLNNFSTLLSILLLEIVEFLKNFDWLIFKLVRPHYLSIALYYFLLYQLKEIARPSIIPYFRRRSKRIVASLLAVCMVFLFFQVSIIFNDQLKTVVLDVGQGDATFLSLPSGENILVDGGPDDDIVADFLYQNGVRRVDLMVVTHFHYDHYQGFFRVLEEFNVGLVLIPEPVLENQYIDDFFDLLASREQDYQLVNQPGSISLADINLDFYRFTGQTADANNNSIVTKVDYGDFQLLLTGDAEKELEEYLVEQQFKLESDVLRVAHHGSNTSSTKEFLREVQAEVAIISAGRWNPYGHPHPEVVARLKNKGKKVLKTKSVGAIIIKSDSNSYTLQKVGG
ncbi:DNA internalization-related competence protein ComEC/Rec2 [Fuchsiella alkaliacetigena]|uniref:DNA internalization-related competence protein ComEC/Rec2 n=1 Tax=Fuchsiella alkaliacetigena TaxID=957042 RepID=UPI00200A8CEA|nr:DNA internalization-related competence protein ComEC/Rec2 [Fuchsiella alkaliacetigena]MCK8825200.1 DNA internalization-related competence protein ComEC/Rec2 [Fuchsiella alkaliacetigena]